MVTIFKNKKIVFVSLFLVLAIAVACLNLIPAKAEVIYQEDTSLNKIDFQFKNYNGSVLGVNYMPIGDLSYNEDEKKYTIKTNAFVMWEQHDNISFAYNWYHQGYGDQGKIVIETTIVNHAPEKQGDAMHENASIGICIRNADNPSARELFLHCRANRVGVVWRTKEEAGTSWIGDSKTIPYSSCPVYLRVELQGNAARCSVRFDENEAWKSFSTIYVNLGENLMAGIAAHSCNQNSSISSSFKDYKVSVEAPAGSKYTPVGEGEGEEEQEEENPCPPDPEITDDVLFRETFTDGSMTNATDYSGCKNKEEMAKRDIINPIWSNEYSIDGDISTTVIDVEDGNRFWHRNGSSDTYFFPNKDWYDYSFSVDLKFGPENTEENSNEIDLYTRFKANRNNGFFGYRISMYKNNTVEITKIFVTNNPKETGARSASCVKVTYDYLKTGWNTWRIDAFDNRISVYCNDELVATCVDDDIKNYSVNSFGGIGIGSNGCDLCVDNITVKKLVDLLGGDFDNKIGGNWDSPIPDYIESFEGTIE